MFSRPVMISMHVLRNAGIMPSIGIKHEAAAAGINGNDTTPRYFLLFSVIFCSLFLGRKRALKQTITRQQKLERRMKREEKEAARKQYTFMERINIRRMKNL